MNGKSGNRIMAGFLVTFALGSGLLSACSKSAETSAGNAKKASAEPVEITVWTWPDNDKTFEKTVPIFEQKHPGIKVKVQAFGQDYANKLLTGLVGNGPDVAMVEIGTVAKFKSKKGFVDLAKPPYSAKQTGDNYAKFSWDYVKDDKGTIFALPKNTGPGAMFYRRDLFEKAGLPTDPEKVHELLATWDDFINVGKKLTVDGKQWMVATPDEIYTTIRAESGVSNFDDKGNLQISSAISKDALKYAKAAKDAGITSPIKAWTPEWNATMASGTVATYFYGNWFGGLLKDVYAKDTGGKWGITYAPAYNNNSAFNSGGDFIGILETSKHKNEAWEFIKFVTQDSDSLKIMYQKNDLYPAWIPALKENWMNEPDTFFNGQVTNKTFLDVSNKMVPPVTNPNDPVVATAMGQALTDIVQGKRSIDDALKEAEKQINAKLQK